MGTNRWMRASDRDRDEAVELLRDAYTVGRLSREEFDERLVAAYSARTWGELQDLTADFPAWPAASLPSDTLARGGLERARPRRYAQAVWMCVLVLAAGVIGRVFPAALWAVALVSAVLFFSLTRGPGRRRR
jgi:uncharacterized membrane protein